jgi:hypothetical protein
MGSLKVVSAFAAFAVFFVTAAQAQQPNPPRPPQMYHFYHPTSARAAVSCTSQCGPGGSDGFTVCKSVVSGQEVSRNAYICLKRPVASKRGVQAAP